MASLPDINKRQSSSRASLASNSDCSLSDRRCSSRSAASSDGRGALFTPSPPPGQPCPSNRSLPTPPPPSPGQLKPSNGALPISSPPHGQQRLLDRPRTSIGISRQHVEYIRVSRSEYDRREQVLSNLRSQIFKLNSQISELQRYKQDFEVLQSVCEGLGEQVGATVKDCAASTTRDVLQARIQSVLQEHKSVAQEHESKLSELEQCQGELAAAKVKLSLAETDAGKVKKTNEYLETELDKTKSEVETLQQTCARTGASMSSLRHQLSLAKEKAGKESQESSSEVAQLQTEVGIAKKKLAEKEDELKNVELSLTDLREDYEELATRLADTEASYTDLGFQLGRALRMETKEESFDAEVLLNQVQVLSQEREQVQQKCTQLESTVKSAEVDTHASRETILRLVSENKKHSKGMKELVSVQEELEEQRELVKAAAKEREELQRSLVNSNEAVGAMKRELQNKDKKVSELARTVDSYKEAAESEKSRNSQMENKYGELLKTIGSALSVDTDQPKVLVDQVKVLIQTCSGVSQQLQEQTSDLEQRGKEVLLMRSTSSQIQEELEVEREKMERLEGELEAAEIVKQGMKRDLDKLQIFFKRMGRVVGMEQETEAILAGGDFAHDAILMKAEQLVKQESESLLSKQTAMYSLQRKLKACRQSLESKTLHLGLAQRKLETMEERLKGSGAHETELAAANNKARSLERQIERLQGRVTEQRDTISQLKMESNQLQRTKDYCQKLEEEEATLVTKNEHLEQLLSRQSQQLCELRQKVKQKQSVSGKELDDIKSQLETTKEDKQKLLKGEAKLAGFRSAVQKLLAVHDPTLAEGDASDFDLMTSLERLLATQEKYKNTVKCLEASLRQLELGFKNNYQDALTLLNSD